MDSSFDADRALVASQSSQRVVSTKGFDHGDCPRCKGAGFYLAHEGRGYFRDGSFEHNEWSDCDHSPDDNEGELA